MWKVADHLLSEWEVTLGYAGGLRVISKVLVSERR
jgi:hypothetical protein